ncbi:MAG: hypothetical protein Q8P97_01705 [bacterium]|nr:hypothetical protein [bacterium]
MKTFIVTVNIILGLAIIYGGFQFGFSNYQIATRTDFYNKNISAEEFNKLCQGHEGDGKYAAPCMYKTYKELTGVYNSAKENIARLNQRDTENTKQQFPATLSLALLVMALGLSAIPFAIAFQKSKKWGAIGLVILNLLVLVGTSYFAIMILLGFGEVLLLSVPLIALCWLVFETLFIRRYWLEFN